MHFDFSFSTLLQLLDFQAQISRIVLNSNNASNGKKVTYSAPPYNQADGAFQSSHSVSSMKHKTLQFALEWRSRTQEFQVGRQLIRSTGCGDRESPVTYLPNTTKSQLLDERSDDREGMSEADVNRLAT